MRLNLSVYGILEAYSALQTDLCKPFLDLFLFGPRTPHNKLYYLTSQI